MFSPHLMFLDIENGIQEDMKSIFKLVQNHILRTQLYQWNIFKHLNWEHIFFEIFWNFWKENMFDGFKNIFKIIFLNCPRFAPKIPNRQKNRF